MQVFIIVVLEEVLDTPPHPPNHHPTTTHPTHACLYHKLSEDLNRDLSL